MRQLSQINVRIVALLLYVCLVGIMVSDGHQNDYSVCSYVFSGDSWVAELKVASFGLFSAIFSVCFCFEVFIISFPVDSLEMVTKGFFK